MRSAAKYIWLFIVVAFVGGFLLVETSGLIGSSGITPTTAVAEVNGHEILYSDWQARLQQTLNNQQRARPLSQDEVRQIENETLDEMIMQTLLQQEFKRRHITVSSAEILEYARYAPPPFLYNAPDLQTDGRFDPQKYQRLLSSPQARQGGLLVGLESYYRTEIPKEKLFEQITDGLYIPDADLWRTWRDEHDTAQVSYVAWHATATTEEATAQPEAEARAYFEKHKDEYDMPGRAWMSVVNVPRKITAADTAAARAKLARLRTEIVAGAKFEEVAKRESQDSVSAVDGGDLGRGGKGRFVKEFEDAAYKLRAKEVSGIVSTPYGLHLIKVDERKGDTLALRHILVRVTQSDSAALATDQQADSLARIAVGAEDPAKFDTAAKRLNLAIHQIEAFEGRPASMGLTPVPSASAWAFGGARAGEISELFDDENGYWMARLDSISQGGEPKFERAQDAIRMALAREKSLDKAMPAAQAFATSAATTGLEVAAKQAGLSVVKSPNFSRASFVPGLGQFTQAIGAAFGLPVGSISAPVRVSDGIYVMRVERRVNADKAQFDKQVETLQSQRVQQLRQQKLQLFHADLRKAAKIEDYRKDINAAARRLTAAP